MKRDLIPLFLVITVLLGVPLGLMAENSAVWSARIPQGAKVFTLTGHRDLGWISGRVRGYDVIGLGEKEGPPHKPVLVVNKGDLVTLKLTSADVIHGFSLKGYGIFIEDGVRPGKVRLVTFKADKPGVFTFSCNIICGDHHKNMQGTLIVRS